jgi:hypothetical protein
MSVLCEATRSQQVRSGGGNLQSFFVKKQPATTPAAEQEQQKVHIKNNALILLEDVDIVFGDLGTMRLNLLVL